MERELSVRQRRFAAEIAAGNSRAKAYALAYPNQHMKKSSLEVESKKAAKHPKVKAEIERLRLQLLPPVEDLRAIYQHSLSAVIKLSIESHDDRVRFDAARWLRAEVEREEQKLAAARTEPEAERLLTVLRSLYNKIEGSASHPAQPPLEMVPDAMDADGSPGEPPTTSVDVAEVHAEAGVSEKPDERSDAVDALASVPQVMKRVTPPGYFPAKFKRIPSAPR
jgi:hypothetical protein